MFAESSVNPKVEQAIARESGARIGAALWADSLGPDGLRRRDLRRLDRGEHPRDRRRAHAAATLRCRLSRVRRSRRPLHAARARRVAAARGARAACSAPGSCCAGSRSSPTRSGRRRSRGSWSPAPWGIAPQLAALGARARLRGRASASRGRAASTRTPPRASCSSRRWRSARCSPRDVYGSGAGVDRLLFGTLIGAQRPRPRADRGRRRAALAPTPRCAARGSRPASIPTARARSACARRGRRVLLALVAGAVVVALDAVGALLVCGVLVVPAATVRCSRARLTLAAGGHRGARRGRGRRRTVVADALDVGAGAGMAMLGGAVVRRAWPRSGLAGGGRRERALVRVEDLVGRLRAPARRAAATSPSRPHAGESSAVLGPNGGGKTTLFRALLGELPFRRGTVELAGRPAYVPQTERSRLDFPVSALEVALMGAYGRTPWCRRLARADRAAARAALERVGLADRAHGALRRALGRPAPARPDRPRARPGRAGAPARRAAVGRRRPAPRASRRCSPSCAGRAGRCWSPPTTPARRARGSACSASTARQVAFGPPAAVLTPDVLRATYGGELIVSSRRRRRAAVEHHHHEH